MNADTIIGWLKGITAAAGAIPVVAPFAAMALALEGIAGAAIKAYAATSGKTLQEAIDTVRTGLLDNQKQIDDWNAAHPEAAGVKP